MTIRERNDILIMTRAERAAINEIIDSARDKMRSQTEMLEAFERGDVDGYAMYETAEYLQNALSNIAGQLEEFLEKERNDNYVR